MPYTSKFRKLLKATRESYGAKKGTPIAFAIAKKRNWKT